MQSTQAGNTNKCGLRPLPTTTKNNLFRLTNALRAVISNVSQCVSAHMNRNVDAEKKPQPGKAAMER